MWSGSECTTWRHVTALVGLPRHDFPTCWKPIMLRSIGGLFRRSFTSLFAKNAKRRPIRRASRSYLSLECLEDRVLPTVALGNVLNAFHAGARSVVQNYGPALASAA